MGMLRTFFDHPEEITPLLKLRIASARLDSQVPTHDADLAFCYRMLQRVSRSFVIVIQQLGADLRDAICIFYLVLRALDTVEDDMSIPVDTKLPILKTLHKNIYDPSWHFSCGANDYKVLMDNFYHVSAVFLRLEKRYQDAIEEATKKMGHGMAKFLCKEVETIKDYDEYCHYVAGLVGYGLSRLFHAGGLEDLAPDHLSNSMGLFLQKTNIIRDYLEDIDEIPKPRMFWPREIWGKYASKLEDFKAVENSDVALECLNEMITNALSHALDCLKYLSFLKDHAVFRFCAIPQIMAIGTLAQCYNNIHVFRGVVKIRRGLTAKIMDRIHTMADAYGAFFDFADMLATKIDKRDPSAQLTRDYVEAIEQACRASGTLREQRLFSTKTKKKNNETFLLLLMILFLVAALYIVGKSS